MTEFFKLPDYIEVEELKQYFIKFLENYANNISDYNEYALEELIELADRQWHTYELLDSEIRALIEEYLIQILNFDEKAIDDILYIVPRLGLKRTFDNIIRQKKHIKNAKILNSINEAEKEYGEHVENPYWSLENL